MEYRILKRKNSTLITAKGIPERQAVFAVGTLIRTLLENGPPKIILDIDGLEGEREIFLQIGIINAFKKEIRQAGGSLTVMTNRPHIKNFLSSTGLDRIFPVTDDSLLFQMNPPGSQV
jgi:hypothetical protein